MTHIAKNFDHLIGKIPGLSETQMRTHLGLYHGYVKKINEIEERIPAVDPVSANYSYAEYSELQRRRAVPYNGAHLHELYFENLSPDQSVPSSEVKKAIDQNFGSMENWILHAKAGLTSAHGWLLLVRSRTDGLLRNNVIEEHHRGVFVDSDILLCLDGWEHAYMIDYGTSKADYIEAVLSAVDWQTVSRRFATYAKTAQILSAAA